MSDTYRKESRRDWHRAGDTMPDTENLKLGCLQRIADATELMAQRHQELVNERDRYKRWYDQERETAKSLSRRLIAARGQITKLKRKASVEPT